MEKINGSYLKELRLSHNYTIRELAQILYVSKSTINNWEKNDSLDSLSTVQTLCDFYKIPFNEFLEQSGAMPQSMQSETAVSENEPAKAAIPIQETKIVKAEGTETRLKRKLPPILKTGIIAFSIGLVLSLLFILAIYLYVYSTDSGSTIGNHVYIFFGIPELLWLCFTFLLLPTGMAILIHYFIRRKK